MPTCPFCKIELPAGELIDHQLRDHDSYPLYYVFGDVTAGSATTHTHTFTPTDAHAHKYAEVVCNDCGARTRIERLDFEVEDGVMVGAFDFPNCCGEAVRRVRLK